MNSTQGVRGVFDEQGHRGSLGCIVSGQVTETGLCKSNSSSQSLEDLCQTLAIP